ncbi:glycoside hydrolase family 105 protein [Spirosoma sp. KUDC1026]|uniref:glycoside hydrolase family 88/105 protein n=1 Tax=Spirosoma sp. KUDC1026 TaxID=2745947 RepID=UPI00159BBE8F|nr:glycoside hydrolase family 88 protein [Spirosoma sp. KUDC1026]QKZ13503.1 glycoside hydrolase family 88 protein [Spirosoma sp. KUDC1026]
MTTKQQRHSSHLALLGVLACTLFGFTRPYPSNRVHGDKVPDDKVYFKPAYIKETLIKAATWQLNHPKHATTDWTNGAFYSGVFAAYQTTKSPLLMDSLMAMGERTNWQPGRRYDHADDIAICQTYLNLYRLKKDRRMIQPTIDTVQKLRTTPGQEVQKNGITWWWCDALFMAPPVLTGLGRTLNESWYYKLNDSLFRQTYDRLYNTQEHLFARDGSYLISADGSGKKESNGQKIFWSRGNGWVMGGLVQLLNELPANYPQRDFYVTLYKQMSERLLGLQQADGLWRASLLDPDAYPGGEASGSGFDCYAMAWGINNGILPKDKYLPAVRKAWVALNKLVSDEGRVGWVQPIGADPRRNFNADSWEVYGTGAFLLAGSEVIKLK